MNDPRKIRQTLQTVLALAMIVAPVAMAKPFDWRALVVSILGGVVAILTNPRLVTGLSSAMPVAGAAIPTEVDGAKPTAGEGPYKPSGLKTTGGPGAAALVLILGSLLLAGAAQAQTPAPQLGWCSADGMTCVGPSLTVTLTRITADGKVQAGVNPGACYGLTRNPDAAYAYGVDGCLAFALNQSGLGANILSPAVLFKVNKFRAGVSAEFTQAPGVGLSRVIGFAFGGGFDIQALTAPYAKAQRQEAVMAAMAAKQ